MPDTAMRGADQRFMAAAIRLGRRELGRAWPNPAVGALIVSSDGRIVGRGWTRQGGRPHAETVALDEAAGAARGATAYVSLEPCSHHGGTPPCVDRLIDAGVARVVFALEDPNPKVKGRGQAALSAAGIAVICGVLETPARAVHAGHIMRVTQGRPWVTLKLAVSRDGCIAGPGNVPVAISGPQARARAHMLRATHDAILVGVGTALSDDPELTCRLPGMAERSPVRVVLDSRLRLPRDCRLLRTVDAAPVWLVTGEAPERSRAAALESAGARLLRVESDGEGHVAVRAALEALAGQGITRLLVEGGAAVAGALLAADLVDEAVIFDSDREIGAGGLPAIPGAGLAALTGSGAYRRIDARALGDDRMATYLRAR